jgi:hypothetical protein
MKEHEVTRKDVKRHPTNPNWTMPKTWGVWKLPAEAIGERYRMGNNPLVEKELTKKFGGCGLITLYTSRAKARAHADELNQ